MELQNLADALAGLSTEDILSLATLLASHDNNVNKVGLTQDGDPVPPDPTHPH